MKSSGQEQHLFPWKLRKLLESPTFQDISFNCKDGAINGNRLMLSVYSNFLADIFQSNPLITCHPLNRNEAGKGINLPEVSVADMEYLLNAINSGDSIPVPAIKMADVLTAAKMLRIDLIQGNSQDGVVEVEAMPKLFKDQLDMLMVNGESEEEEHEFDIETEFHEETDKDSKDGGGSDEESKQTINGSQEDTGMGAQFFGRSKVCPFCNITCKSWQGMRRHVGHYHGTNPKMNAKEKVVCKCGMIFSKNAKGLFREHRKTCLSYIATAFICDICNTPFHEIPSLNNHKYTVHGILLKPNSCLCGEVLRNRHQLRKHFINCKVYKEAAIFCKDCNLPFLTHNHLQQHLHSAAHKNVELDLITKGLKAMDEKGSSKAKDKKIVVCKCGQCFSKHSRLLYREHRRTCAAFLKEAAICDVCQNPFDDMISLSIHQTTVHGLDRNTNSCVCGQTMKNRNQLRKHQIECEAYKSMAILCKECNLPFPSHNHFQQHLKSTAHQNAINGILAVKN